jgi:predicted GNAT family acetyltransferase
METEYAVSPERDVAVVHDTVARQFRVGGGDEAAVLQYTSAPGRITFLHTFVPDALRGRGIAGALARAGLEHAKAEGLGVVPFCPFVRSYLEKHPEYQALVVG